MASTIEILFPVIAIISSIATLFVALIPFGQRLRERMGNDILSQQNDEAGYFRKSRIMDFIINIVDHILAFIALLLCAPLLMLEYIVLAIIYNDTPIKKDIRIGYNQKTFTLYTFNIKHEFCKYRIVKFMELTSINEFPIYWNVLRGDISLFGIRPLKPEWLSNMTAPRKSGYQYMLSMKKPGLVSLSTIFIDYHKLHFDDYQKYDRYFIKNDSILFRMKLIIIVMSSAIASK